ncbi:MAG: BMP family ABC transporter substrate-binding protein [Firmicutes bacterium]|nr:BMP family ABC transporter substrate-binding protein [Bacillota bacterium]MBQ9060275.1 BMP family ABC transporter substrate-binding protein [Bacillota bacterium]
MIRWKHESAASHPGAPGGLRPRGRFRLALLAAAVTLGLMTCLCACGEEEETAEEPTSFELALITNEIGVDDGSFNQTTWAAMQAFGEENGLTCQYYPSDDESYMKTIREAKSQGAQLVVLAGSQLETIAYEAQDKYEDLKFVLIDGVPRDKDYNYNTGSNATGVLFAEQEAGYLAGYAAVTEGYTKLGYMGGDALPPVKRYGYGFVQGAAAAAEELGRSGVHVQYTYLGTFEASDEIESEAYDWFTEDGVQVIFACGGSIGESVMAAAETAGGKVIGVDADQSALSETVITSAKKETGKAITDILKNYKRNNFEGGAILNYSAENGGIGLEITNARMEVFTQEVYDQVFADIKSGARKIVKDIGDKSISTLVPDTMEIEVIDD